jgi:hypothetical protein
VLQKLNDDLKSRNKNTVEGDRIIHFSLMRILTEMLSDTMGMEKWRTHEISDMFEVKIREREGRGHVTENDMNVYRDRFRSILNLVLGEDNVKFESSSFIPEDNKDHHLSESKYAVLHCAVSLDHHVELDPDNERMDIFSRNARMMTELRKMRDGSIPVAKGTTDFSIMKSSQYQDWTQTEAAKDAQEMLLRVFSIAAKRERTAEPGTGPDIA